MWKSLLAVLPLLLPLLLPFPLAAQTMIAPPSEAERLRYPAQRATGRIDVDGRLDEASWLAAPVTEPFRQMEPENGKPAALQTLVRVLYDDRNLYVGVVARDPLGRAGARVADLRRKFTLADNDVFGIILDPFNDGRNALGFQTTPYGNQRELQVYDSELVNREWEAVWRVRTQRSDSGWTAEFAIPWASVRHAGDGRAWGANFLRVVRRTNEVSTWSTVPRNLGEYRMRFAGLITGLEPPRQGVNLRLRPYGVLRGSRNPAAGSDAVPRTGGEVIWAPSANTTVELTANTDFAQADVDRQVVNLTRFSVFFPERRQFFLESASLFQTGTEEGFIVQPFFSRRIGLSEAGEPIALQGGARLVRRDSRSALGFLATRQEGTATQGPTTIAVGRYSRNFGATSRLGAIVTGRLDEAGSAVGGQQSMVAALDGLTRFGEAVTLAGMGSFSVQPDGGVGGAGYWRLVRQTNQLYVGARQTLATRRYNPTTGFVSRADVLFSQIDVQPDIRPRWRPAAIRSFRPYASVALYHGPTTGRLQEGELIAQFETLFQSGTAIGVYGARALQRPTEPFPIARGVTIPAGELDFTTIGLYGNTQPGASLYATWNLSTGGFFGGHRDRLSGTGRWTPTPHLALGLSSEVNRLRDIGVERADVTTWLVQPEARVAVTPRVQLTAFWQYSSDAQRSAWNVRFAWEFQPLSYLFIVYNDLRAVAGGRLTAPASLPSEQLIVKLQYLWQL